MDSFCSCSSDGYSLTHGSSVNHGVSCSMSTGVNEGISYSSTYTGTPSRSYTGDPATIARSNYHHELRDALIVLKNCGALRLAEEREWCIAVLQRMLLELFSDDVA
jgi:hypothetical protein